MESQSEFLRNSDAVYFFPQYKSEILQETIFFKSSIEFENAALIVTGTLLFKGLI